MTRDPRSSATRSRSLPKFARALSAETTMLPVLSVRVPINSPLRYSELYRSQGRQSMKLREISRGDKGKAYLGFVDRRSRHFRNSRDDFTANIRERCRT